MPIFDDAGIAADLRAVFGTDGPKLADLARGTKDLTDEIEVGATKRLKLLARTVALATHLLHPVERSRTLRNRTAQKLASSGIGMGQQPDRCTARWAARPSKCGDRGIGRPLTGWSRTWSTSVRSAIESD